MAFKPRFSVKVFPQGRNVLQVKKDDYHSLVKEVGTGDAE